MQRTFFDLSPLNIYLIALTSVFIDWFPISHNTSTTIVNIVFVFIYVCQTVNVSCAEIRGLDIVEYYRSGFGCGLNMAGKSACKVNQCVECC